MEQIAELFQALISPDQFNQELIDQATHELTELYKKPETLEILFNLYLQASDQNIQLLSAIGLKYVLSNIDNWNYFRQNNESENVKNSILQILTNEQDLLLFRNIVESSLPILKTDFSTWPEYLELTRNYSTDEKKFLLSVIMANSVIKSMINMSEEDNEFLGNIWEFLTNLALQGLSSNDDEIIKESSDLVANLFAFVDINDSNLLELFSALFQVFTNLVERGSPICGNIVGSFESISEVPDFCFPNSLEIAEQFLPVLMNSSTDIDLKCLLLNPLISFLFNDEESDKSGIIGTLYDIIFTISSESFIEDACKDEQENMLICNSNLERLLEEYDGEQIRQLIFGKEPSSSSKGEIITYGLSLISFTQRYPELLLHGISSCIKFGFACIEADDHAVQETGFELFQNLFERQNEAYFGIQDHFFEIVLQLFAVNHQPLLTIILKCLYNYLDFINIKKEHVDNLFQSLFQVLKEYDNPEIQFRVIDCFTNLVQSLAEEVLPYASELFPLVIQAATEANRPEQYHLKASSVECLGVLIKYTQGITEIEPILQIFVDCIGSDEDILKSAGFGSLTNAVSAKIPEVEQILPAALSISLSIIQSEPALVDDDESDEVNNIILDVWQYTMDFIEKICKNIPQCIQEHVEEFKEALIKLIDGEIHLEIESMAIETCSKLITLCPPDEIVAFLVKVVEILIDTNRPKTASKCFDIIIKFIKKQQELEITVGENIISSACQVGLDAMKRDLTFQGESKESEFDLDFSNSLYIFFEEIASLTPALFPLNDFWNCAKSIFDKGVEYEQAEVISVLRVVFATCHEEIPKILKKKIVEIFVKKLEICDCDNPPFPIGAVRTVVDKEPSLIEKYIPNIMEFIDELLAIEYVDQPSHSMTMDYAVSLLFSLFTKVFKENFDVEKYLKTMLHLMPATTDQIEAINCYENMVFLCIENDGVMSHFSSEIVRIFSQTFALKVKEWEIISLPEDTLQKMAILLQNLISAMKQGQEILEASVPDELSMQRFQQRFSKYLIS